MSDIDIIGSFSAEPTITGQLETTLVIQGNVDSQFPAQVSVVSTTTGDPGTDASVVNAGTPGNARLKFTIPRGATGAQGNTGPQGEQGPQGDQGEQGEKGDTGDTGATGPANTLAIGTVEDGATADATITGTAPNQTLNLRLPKGDKGDTGDQGDPGAAGADGVVQSLVAGSNITIDATDPANPIINSTASGSGDLLSTNNLSDLADAATARTNLGLGTAAVADTGTSAGNVVALVTGGKLPSVDGSQLTNLPGGDIAATVHAATSKTTPVDADEFALVDSAASNVLKKLTWANLKATLAAWLVSAGWIRERLTANRTYYVLTTGSDSNNGLANTSGGAFLTIQKAINTAFNLDLSGFDVTIQVGSGTYAGAIVAASAQVGAGNIKLLGDTTTPSNVVISTTNATNITVSGGGTKLSIGGFKFTNSGGSSIAQVYGNGGSLVSITGKCEFGAADFYHIISEANATVNITSISYIISAGGQAHWLATTAGVIISSGCTWTITGTPAFSQGFAYARTGALISTAGNTVGSGGATGPRYLVDNNSVINTFGSGASYFPGNSAGSTTSGGQYA